jgi:aryl-alcohol dehydrogenase-like predicted oxidoreductase
MANRRPLGATGMEIGPLVFGGSVFRWTVKDDNDAFAILDRFVERGGTMIDSADIYSYWAPGNKGGESDEVIGAWCRRSGKRDQIQIITKVGQVYPSGEKGLAPARILKVADEALMRLGVDTIDVFMAHVDDDSVPVEDVLGAFDTLIRAGKVRAIGASNFTAQRFRQSLETAERCGLPKYQVLQPHYNLVERGEFDGELQDSCIANNVGVIPYYGLAAGYLTGKYRDEDFAKGGARANRVAKFHDTNGPAVIAAMDEVAAETDASLAQIALAWLAAQPGIASPIISATSLAQLDEVFDFENLVLTQDQIDRLTAAGA